MQRPVKPKNREFEAIFPNAKERHKSRKTVLYSRLLITRTLANSNLALFLSLQVIFYINNFILDNSNLFQFPLKVRDIGSQLLKELKSLKSTYFMAPLSFVFFSIFLVYDANANEFGIPN